MPINGEGITHTTKTTTTTATTTTETRSITAISTTAAQTAAATAATPATADPTASKNTTQAQAGAQAQTHAQTQAQTQTQTQTQAQPQTTKMEDFSANPLTQGGNTSSRTQKTILGCGNPFPPALSPSTHRPWGGPQLLGNFRSSRMRLQQVPEGDVAIPAALAGIY